MCVLVTVTGYPTLGNLRALDFGVFAFLPPSLGPPGDCPWRHYVRVESWLPWQVTRVFFTEISGRMSHDTALTDVHTVFLCEAPHRRAGCGRGRTERITRPPPGGRGGYQRSMAVR